MNADIERLAREAGFEFHERKQQIRVGVDSLVGVDSTDKLIKFASLIAEECCALIEIDECALDRYDDGHNDGQRALARRIRAKFPAPKGGE